jgi:hypothetical protein
LHPNNAVLLSQIIIIEREVTHVIARGRAIIGSNAQVDVFLIEFVSFYQQINTGLHISFDALSKHDLKINAACKNEFHFFVLRPIVIGPSLFQVNNLQHILIDVRMKRQGTIVKNHLHLAIFVVQLFIVQRFNTKNDACEKDENVH